jgi:hypothetical protein
MILAQKHKTGAEIVESDKHASISNQSKQNLIFDVLSQNFSATIEERERYPHFGLSSDCYANNETQSLKTSFFNLSDSDLRFHSNFAQEESKYWLQY